MKGLYALLCFSAIYRESAHIAGMSSRRRTVRAQQPVVICYL